MNFSKLFHGDCQEELKKIDDNSVDLIITDPPYGIDQMNHDWDSSEINESKSKSLNKACQVKGMPVGMKFNPDDAKNLGKFLLPIASEMFRVLKPGGFCLVFSQPRSSHHVALSFEESSFEVRDQLIWEYGAGQGKAQGMQNFIRKNKNLSEEQKQELTSLLDGLKTPQLTPTFETIWLFQKTREGKFVENYLKHGVGLVNFKNGPKKVKFEHRKPKGQERKDAGDHPTVKPVSLLEELIETFSFQNQTVLDAFMGSGTTGVACLKNNRNFIGIEKEKKFFDNAKERIEALKQS